MEKQILLNKPRGPTGKGLIWLKEIEKSYNYIPWSLIFLKLCRNWSSSKQEVRDAIIIFSELGLVDVSFRGVKLNYKIKDED